jgi:uncharacterized protein involved in exopolysaccharide biosynthesis
MKQQSQRALERFEAHLPLLKHLVARALATGGGAAKPLVTAGAQGLWQAALDFGENPGSFAEAAEVAVSTALLDHMHFGTAQPLPEALASFAPKLDAMAAQLQAEHPPQALATYGALMRRPNAMPLPEDEFPVLVNGSEGALLSAIGGIFRRHWPLIAAIALVTEVAVFAMVKTAPKSYKAETTVNTGIASGISATGAPLDWFKAGALMGNLTEILLSRAVLDRTIQSLKLDLPPEKLAKRIEIERVNQTDLLKISATALSAAEAAELANVHVREFMAYYSGMTGRDAGKANQFISAQAQEAEKRLRTAEDSLSRFKEATLPEAQLALSEQLADTRRLRDETQQLIAAAQSGLSMVESELKRLKADPGLAAAVMNSPEVDAAGERLKSLRENLADARSVLGSNHPSVKDLESQIAKADGQLKVTTRRVAGGEEGMADVVARRIALKVELAQNQAKLAAIDTTLRELEPKVKSASSAQVTLAQLQREVEIAATEYQRLSERAGETRVAASGAATLPLTIIDQAVPPIKPESQKLPVKLALGLIVSLLFGGVIGYLLDLRRKPEPEV